MMWKRWIKEHQAFHLLIIIQGNLRKRTQEHVQAHT